MADALVVATGGLSLPASGVSPIAYKIAESFGIDVIPPRAGLVPLTLDKTELEHTKALSGISLPATLSVGGKSFTEQLLFTHRGISGPVTLQISNFWKAGDTVTADLLPGFDVTEFLKENHGNKQLKTVLSYKLPARLVEVLVSMGKLIDKPVSKLSTAEKEAVEELLHAWKLKPSGTEGYKTAEVTLGGVDTAALSSKTMEAKAVPGLYFIGETVDVTGILGGYNLQWCWSSAVACAKGITSPQTQPL
jgi:predicted Rossmann fold flavoprotein